MDARWSESNYGTTVTISGPAKEISHAVATDNSSIDNDSKSGTSYSAPMVAGALARMLGRRPTLTPAQAKAYLVDSANATTISNNLGSPNLILYSGINLSASGSAPSYTPPSGISVTIEGYGDVRPNVGCYFFAYANGGSSEDYSFAWTVGGTLQSSDTDVLWYVNSGQSFTVTVNVSDGVTAGSATKEVTVSSQAGECLVYDQ